MVSIEDWWTGLASDQGIEERLKRVEELLKTVLEKLEWIEETISRLGLSADEALTATRLVIAFSKPVLEAVEASRRLVSILSSHPILDPISRSIIESLSTCEPLTITEITRRVKALRGQASRDTVRSRLRRLMEQGIVATIVHGKRTLYTLRECLREST